MKKLNNHYLTNCHFCREVVVKERGVAAVNNGIDVMFHYGCASTVELIQDLRDRIMKLEEPKAKEATA